MELLTTFWLARNIDGELYLHLEEPKNEKGFFISDSKIKLLKTLHPEIGRDEAVRLYFRKEYNYF